MSEAGSCGQEHACLPACLPAGQTEGLPAHSQPTLSRWRTTTGSEMTMKALGPNSSLNTPPLSMNLQADS